LISQKSAWAREAAQQLAAQLGSQELGSPVKTDESVPAPASPTARSPTPSSGEKGRRSPGRPGTAGSDKRSSKPAPGVLDVIKAKAEAEAMVTATSINQIPEETEASDAKTKQSLAAIKDFEKKQKLQQEEKKQDNTAAPALKRGKSFLTMSAAIPAETNVSVKHTISLKNVDQFVKVRFVIFDPLTKFLRFTFTIILNLILQGEHVNQRCRRRFTRAR
jgi:hypothetical protein